jgi:hypothetical protein
MADVVRPDWWTYPAECQHGHPWGPGRVIVSWLPCQCAPARQAQPRGCGHRTIACRAPGCEWVDYEPWHDPASALGMRDRPVPALCRRGRQAPSRPPVHAGHRASASITLAAACGKWVRMLCMLCGDPGSTWVSRLRALPPPCGIEHTMVSSLPWGVVLPGRGPGVRPPGEPGEGRPGRGGFAGGGQL